MEWNKIMNNIREISTDAIKKQGSQETIMNKYIEQII